MNSSQTETRLSENQQKQFPLSSLLSLLGILGSFLIFVFIIYLAYLPNRADSVDSERVKERELNLKQNKAEQETLANSYGWVNKEEGIVRIPIEQAIELTVEKFQQEENKVASSTEEIEDTEESAAFADEAPSSEE